ncbi:hypothetical protein ICW40_12030 [Actinotalea ferrariae]|uniref:hypothetical protein n=1 Tax=Actinotalea ferrariae TaxID=1386098 RepID=UPI001C8CB368|nr:hypothetical protein [Actinotalea ferrariae]MBX9245530.1 hypothetical protein [Actinotalea ferrariae]
MGFAAGSAPGTVATGARATPEDWRGAYAGVVLGTVTEVGDPTSGPYVTQLDVTGAFGPPVPRRVEVERPRDEWSSPLEIGEHYLIPYREPGFESSLCDPVFEVAEEDVAALVAASETGLWPRPSDAPDHHRGVLLAEPDPTPAVSGAQVPREGWPLLVGGLVAGLAVLGLLVPRMQVGRRPPVPASEARRSTTAGGSTPDA